MKKILLLILFSGSLDSFSQDKIDTANITINAFVYPMRTAVFGEVVPANKDVVKPDTLRAIVLVTLSPNGIAHARMGFVVISDGKRPVYLDCRKRALRLPQVGWDWREVNPNVKQK